MDFWAYVFEHFDFINYMMIFNKVSYHTIRTNPRYTLFSRHKPMDTRSITVRNVPSYI